MQLRYKKKNYWLWIGTFFIILYNVVFFILSNPLENGNRYDRFILVICVLILIPHTFKSLPNKSHTAPFIILLSLNIIYAIFYNSDPNRIFRNLPTISYSLTSFYFAYYYSMKGAFTKKVLYLLNITLIFTACYHFIDMFNIKREILGDEIYTRGNNAGYFFVYLLPLTLITIKNNFLRIALATLFYIFVLYSFKRGAILSYSLAYILFLFFSYRKIKSNKKKAQFLLICLAILITSINMLADKMEIFTYRFGIGGGSGRDIIATSIIENWKDGNILQLIFGYGFFSTHDVTARYLEVPQMAHNDYLEILSNFGFFGLSIYLFAVYQLIKRITFVKKYASDSYVAYITLTSIWLVSSILSGIYMYKDSILIFIALGYIWGQVDRVKNKINTL